MSLAREKGVPVIDFFGLLEDPRHPDRMPARWTADGIHPTVDGYARLGRGAAHQLE
jgi:lysophospholipase L1-like esterase